MEDNSNNKEELINKFLDAAKNNNLDEISPLIDMILQSGISIDVRDKEDYPAYKRTALIHACKCEDVNFELIKLLIDKGANINMKDQEDKSPLLAIAEDENPNTEILEYLISKGASVNSKDEYGRIILFSVCKNENANIGVINIIIESSENLTDGLKGACNSDNLNTEIMNILIEKGANLNKKDKPGYPHYGNTPFGCACENSNVSYEIINFIFDKKGDPNMKNQDGKTPLHIICENSNNNEDILGLFLENGAQINAQDNDGKSCIHYAFEKNSSEEVIKYLIEKGANTNLQDKEGRSALYYACKNDNPNMDLINILFEKQPNYTDGLLGACLADTLNEDLLRTLLEKGADANKKDRQSYPAYGKAPLHSVCSNANPTLEILKLILEKTSINIKSSSEIRTALHFACKNESPNEEIIKELIENGANLNERDSDEHSPFFYACMNENIGSDLIEYLITKGAVLFDDGLKAACQNTNPKSEVLKMLIEKGANPNKASKEGYPEYKKTPLHYLCLNKGYSVETFDAIMEKCTNLNVIDSEGGSPLYFACKNENSNIDVVEYLIMKGMNDWNGALRGACQTDTINCDLIEILIGKGANPNERDLENNFCINLACDNRSTTIDLVKILFKSGASANSKGKYDRQPLHLICDNYNISLELVQLIIENGGDLDGRDDDDKTPLLTISDSNSYKFEIIKELIEKGSNINAKNKNKHSPLFFVFKNSNKLPDYIEYYFEKGANDYNGGLMGLCQSDKLNIEEFDLLIKEKKANVNARDYEGKTPLILLCKNEKVSFEAVKYLLEHKADVNGLDNEGDCALYYFTKNSNSSVDIINILIKFGANRFDQAMRGCCESDALNLSVMEIIVKKADLTSRSGGYTPGRNALIQICENKSVDVEHIALLVGNGSPINEVDRDGKTALHLACINEIPKIDVVKYLIEKGADFKIEDKELKTAFNYLYKNPNESAIEIANFLITKGCNDFDESLRSACTNETLSVDAIVSLIDKKANLNKRGIFEYPNYGKTSLHLLCENRNANPDVLDLLLSKKANPNIKDAEGKTPLHYLCENDSLSLSNVERLIHFKADPNLKDKQDKSVLHFACKSKVVSIETIELLVKNGGANDFSDGLCGACDGDLPNVDIVKFLLEKKANPLEVNQIAMKKNAFLFACENRNHNTEIVKLFLQNNKQEALKSRDFNEKNGFHLICNASNIDYELFLLVSKEYEPNLVSDDGKTALHYLAENYNSTPIKYFTHLIDIGYDINIQDNDGRSPFYYLCKSDYFSIDYPLYFLSKGQKHLDEGLLGASQSKNNKFDLVKMLIEMGANAKVVNDDEKNCLHFIAEYGCNSQLATYFVSKGCSINAKDGEAKSPLNYACSNDKCSLEFLNKLIELGANDFDGGLLGSCRNGNFDFIELMISKGAKDFSHAFWTHCDSYTVNLDILQLLAERKANVNVKVPHGKSSFYKYLDNYRPRKEIISFLLSKNPDLKVRDEYQNTLLHCAASSDSYDANKILLEAGMNPNEKNKDGVSPLHNIYEKMHFSAFSLYEKYGANDWEGGFKGACYANNFKYMDYMISKGAKDFDGALLKVLVYKYIDLEILQYLIGKGANPNAKDSDGHTSLYFACNNEITDVVNYLLEKGANDYDDGLAGAFYISNDKLIDLMISKGAKNFNKSLVAASKVGRMSSIKKAIAMGANSFDEALREHASNGYGNEVVEFLLSKGADVNKKVDGKNTLHIASKTYYKKSFKSLLKKADLNAQDDDGNTALHISCIFQQFLSIKALLEAKADVSVKNKEGKTAKQICDEGEYYYASSLF